MLYRIGVVRRLGLVAAGPPPAEPEMTHESQIVKVTKEECA